MKLSGRVIARLAEPFEGGGGPSHGTIERIWAAADASDYLGEGNKMTRVLTGLRTLRDGRRAGPGQPALEPDPGKLGEVAPELAETLIASGLVEEGAVAEALRMGETEVAPRADPRNRERSTPQRTNRVSAESAVELASDRRRVMVVHGQDREAAQAIFDWLRSIDLRPSEWNELVKASGAASPFIGDVLDTAFSQAQAVVVLFTPDEQVQLRDGLVSGRPRSRLQSRPNVLFEAGMAFARHPQRTVLVVHGDQELPSDLAGRHYVRLGTVRALRDLAQRLEAAGCPVDLEGSDWLDVSRFPPPLA